MAGTAALGRLTWLVGEVVADKPENATVKTLEIATPGWRGHLPGQHVDVRLTAEDGYQAVRSYSLAAPAADGLVTLTVERLADGEVSPYLADELRVGDQIELRGPVGGYFVWRGGGDGRPLLLIGGGSGVVPLVTMLRARTAGGTSPARLLYSAGSEKELIAREELDRRAASEPDLDVTYTLTRAQPPGWTGGSRRVDREMLEQVAWPAAARPRSFVCGPTGFVELVAGELIALGYPSEDVRTERFGPTGGGAASLPAAA